MWLIYVDNTAIVSGTLSNTPSGYTTTFQLVNAGQHNILAGYFTTALPPPTSTLAAIPVTVGKAIPTITWAAPAAITSETAISSAQLNPQSSVVGIAYSPASGTVPAACTQTITATFTPTDTNNYNTASATVSLTVNKAPLTVKAAEFAKTGQYAFPVPLVNECIGDLALIEITTYEKGVLSVLT